MDNFKIYLRLYENHMLPWEEIDRIAKSAKPSFRTITKTKYYIK